MKFPDMNVRVMQSAVGAAGSTIVHVVGFGIPEDAGSLKVVAFFLTVLDSVSIETLLAVIDPKLACMNFSSQNRTSRFHYNAHGSA